MTPIIPDQPRITNGNTTQSPPPSLADELQQESERLRLLSEKLKKREEALGEMEATYPVLRRYVYAKLREEFAKTNDELPPDVDLEKLAKEEGALPLEAFIHKIRGTEQGS